MARFQKHELSFTDTDGAAYSFFFLAPPDHYTGIETATGVEPIPDGDKRLDMPITKVEELMISPVAYKKVLRVFNSTTNKSKYVDILVEANKVLSVQTDLVGKTYKGGTIQRVLDSRKQVRV